MSACIAIHSGSNLGKRGRANESTTPSGKGGNMKAFFAKQHEKLFAKQMTLEEHHGTCVLSGD